MGPIKNYREEERECATTSGKFNYFSLGPAKISQGPAKTSQIRGTALNILGPYGAPWGPYGAPRGSKNTPKSVFTKRIKF